mmetsp:Transcript_164227/g.526688  ORF Transcript_164227/g.526688 Transcript_164227/m.526688 type:complete len:221 (-) Transcript_164227:507-1169(-)
MCIFKMETSRPHHSILGKVIAARGSSSWTSVNQTRAPRSSVNDTRTSTMGPFSPFTRKSWLLDFSSASGPRPRAAATERASPLWSVPLWLGNNSHCQPFSRLKIWSCTPLAGTRNLKTLTRSSGGESKQGSKQCNRLASSTRQPLQEPMAISGSPKSSSMSGSGGGAAACPLLGAAGAATAAKPWDLLTAPGPPFSTQAPKFRCGADCFACSLAAACAWI